MKVKELIEYLLKVDPELEVNTNVSEDCCVGDYSNVYGIEPIFSVDTLYEYNDKILTEEDEVKECIAEDYDTNDEAKINEIFLTVPVSNQLVITVSP